MSGMSAARETLLLLGRCLVLALLWACPFVLTPTNLLEELATPQQQDTQIEQCRSASSTLIFHRLCCCRLPKAQSLSTGVPRLYVPPMFRRAVFNALHGNSHRSIRETQHHSQLGGSCPLRMLMSAVGHAPASRASV